MDYLQIFRTGYFFSKKHWHGFNKTTNYDFILPSKTCQRHLQYKQELDTSEISCKAINHSFNKALLVFADFFTVNAYHTKSGQEFTLTLTIAFLNLWKQCCRFTHTSFHTA